MRYYALTLLLALLAPPILTLAEIEIPFSIDFGMGSPPPEASSSTDPNAPIPTDLNGKPLSPAALAFMKRMEAARAPPSPHWSDSYTSVCEISSSLSFESYPIPLGPITEDSVGEGLKFAVREIDEFFTGAYPGGFTREERGLRLLRVDFEDLNPKVKRWIEVNGKGDAGDGDGDGEMAGGKLKNNGKGQDKILVVGGVAFFAPGKVLELLPLFAGDENGNVDCGGVFADLEMRAYGADVEGMRVSGGILGKAEMGNSVTVQVELKKLMKKGEGKGKEKGKDEL